MLIRIEEFFKYLKFERNYSDQTLISYKYDIEHFDNFLVTEGIQFNEIDHKIIRMYNSSLMYRDNSRRTIARKNSSLRTYYRFLIRNNYISSNPFEYVERQKIDKKLPEVLTINEIIEILNVRVSPYEEINLRNKSIIHLLYSSGMRVSEIVSIKIRDIDFENQNIIVTGKGNKQRIVLMNDVCIECLKSYLKLARPKIVHVGTMEDQGFVYANKQGKPLTTRSVEIFLKKMGEQMSPPKRIYPHIFRHSFATHLLDGGADLRVIQELLGHSSVQATQVYTHLSNKALKDNYDQAHPHSHK